MTAIKNGETLEVEDGRIEFDGTAALRKIGKPETARRLGVEQSNVSVVLGEDVMLKIYRRLQVGLQPDVEVGRFLSETAGFTGTPSYLGSAAFVNDGGETMTLATAFSFVYNQGDAWTGLLDALARDLEQVRIEPEAEEETFDYPLSLAHILGVRTAELHLAFATPTDDPAFAVEPVRKSDIKSWSAAVAREARGAFRLLREQVRQLPDEVAEDLETLLSAKDELTASIKSAESLKPSGGKTRIHGDYHLGQVLICHDDVMIVDFEGEPQREIDERRAKSSPLRDTAGMLRSFDYLAWAALDRRREIAGSVEEIERRRAMLWRDQAVREFLDAYFDRLADSPAHSAEPETARGLLRLFTIQKALYEIGYEAANRPGWISIPVRGIVDLMRQEGASG
jgi:maltose alpha-D-glucosyltransferase/alpha-amylase